MENTKPTVCEDDEKGKAAKTSEKEKSEADEDEELDIEDKFAMPEFTQDLDDFEAE